MTDPSRAAHAAAPVALGRVPRHGRRTTRSSRSSGHPDDPAPSPLLDNFLDGDRARAPRRRARRSARAGSRTVPGPTTAAAPTSSSRSSGPRRSTSLAGELRRVRDEHGNESIFGGSYGWASAGRFHHAQSQLHRFLNCIGGYTRSVNSYSLGASEVILPARRRRRRRGAAPGHHVEGDPRAHRARRRVRRHEPEERVGQPGRRDPPHAAAEPRRGRPARPALRAVQPAAQRPARPTSRADVAPDRARHRHRGDARPRPRARHRGPARHRLPRPLHASAPTG